MFEASSEHDAKLLANVSQAKYVYKSYNMSLLGS